MVPDLASGAPHKFKMTTTRITLAEYDSRWTHHGDKDIFENTADYDVEIVKKYPHLPWNWSHVERDSWPKKIDWEAYLWRVHTAEQFRDFALVVPNVPIPFKHPELAIEWLADNMEDLAYLDSHVITWLYNGLVVYALAYPVTYDENGVIYHPIMDENSDLYRVVTMIHEL